MPPWSLRASVQPASPPLTSWISPNGSSSETDPVDPVALRLVASDVLDCADRLRATGELPVHPTFFEATTAIAFELFRRADVEVAVIEVGLGGRYDSTNVIAPQVGAITSIGFDHQQFLGDTIEAIAFEKAGIIKSDMDVVIGRSARPGS